MRQHFLLVLCFIHVMLIASAQDSVVSRVILIGDAGETNDQQEMALKHAADHIIKGKTTVLFLGDNIYPHGMGLPGSREEEATREILRLQYTPMRQNGAPVYFLPGNHDWDKSGPDGLEKIKRQWEWLDQQGDSLLKMIPQNGCPDPVEINVSPTVTIIAFDSEWWLFPFNKTNLEADCICRSRTDVLTLFEQLRYKNRHKIILLASHHPFQSYGSHGGRFTFNDHLFPLTAVNNKLYIPLPVIGSLYPFLRGTFLNPEDLKHPLYKDMVKRIDGAFIDFPNLIHVAGHEHGLQYIKSKQLQIVSGAGSKTTNVAKPKVSLFAEGARGYVAADELTDKTMRFTYYGYDKDSVQQLFVAWQPYKTQEEAAGYDSVAVADSVTIAIHPSYNQHGKFHKFLFGENYRKEWAAPVTFPVFRISTLKGGLTPQQLGGGLQSKSLRLTDKNGKEYVIRSVEKIPDFVLPGALRETFARDWVDDVTSAQHPYAALVVPVIADAVHIPHSNPKLGVVASDRRLGVYEQRFKNLIVLFEEREPLGETDNSTKFFKNLQKDNDNTFQSKEFLRARMLDALLGDWDRHDDQWRWFDSSKNAKAKNYLAVPRDRDQVFHLTEGLIPRLASVQYVLPTLRNFGYDYRKIKWSLFKTRFINAYPAFQFSREQWQQEAKKFVGDLPDSVFEKALLQLPKAIYDIRHDVLLGKLKSRRDKLPASMDNYFRFISKIADIQLSDKHELVEINDAPEGLQVRISSMNKSDSIKKELMNKTFTKDLTKEVRIYLGRGDDSVVINNKTSNIKLRLIGGKGDKAYTVLESKKRVYVYDRKKGERYFGDTSRLKTRLSNDSLHTAFTPVNLYNTLMPLLTVGSNADDGFILGAGFRYIKQEGFRKYPYASLQQLMAAHSFSTQAFRIAYKGEWIGAVGKADFTLNAVARAPDNTINFFGRGNETDFIKVGDFRRFYRTRFNIYLIDPALRWHGKKGAVLSVGPSVSYYRFSKDDNDGRFINNISQIKSYDSATIGKEKLHIGAALNFQSDKRNNKILPQWGTFVNVRFQVSGGANKYSASFAQIVPEIALYKSLNARSTIILAERFGGTITAGKTTFYQSAFLGGQENLLGYRQYRFAGQHSFYNNLELRIKLTDVASYILPGQLGITGFWDVGRVFEKANFSDKWHSGVGGGVYFAPASMTVFSFVMGHSTEGWYPYFTMGFRF